MFKRMDEYGMARRVLMAEVSGGLVRGRPRLGLMTKASLSRREIAVKDNK